MIQTSMQNGSGRNFFSNRMLFSLHCVLLMGLLFAVPIWSQTGSSTVRGTVKDPSGGLVSGATVTLTSLETNAERSMRTTSSGTFAFEFLPVGDYEVRVEALGFRKLVVRPVRAAVDNVTDVPAGLEIGEVSSTVIVEAAEAAVQVNTSDATLGNNFTSVQLTQLPIEGRGVLPLLTLQAQVTPDGYVAGGRSDQSNVTLDGVDINDAESSDINRPVLRLNAEAIEEFRVVTVGANADEGRSSAAQINLVTKSGTNNWHGSAFEFNRNTAFTANDFFNNRSGVDRPKLIRNVFGGTFGGPILKDKLFFFYSYEGRRDKSDTSITSLVPLAGLGQGQLAVSAQRCTNPPPGAPSGTQPTCEGAQDFTLTTAQLDNAWSVVHTNPVSIATLAAAAGKYPSNDNTIGDGIMTGGFRFNASTPVNLNSNMARIDWTINKKMSAFFRLNTYYDLDSTVLLPAFPDTPAPSLWAHPWGVLASHSWTLGQNWVNSFRYGLTRQALSQQGDSSANAITFRSVFSPANFYRSTSRTNPVHNIVDDIAWIKGNHTVKFGTNLRFVTNNRQGFSNAFDSASTNYFFYSPAGTAVTDPLVSYIGDPANNLLPAGPNQFIQIASNQNGVDAAGGALIGRYSSYSARFTFGADGSLLPSGTPTSRSFNTNAYDFYIQDSWKITRNLTVGFGLRYTVSTPVKETNGFGVVTDISTEQYLKNREAGAAIGVPFTQPLTLVLAGGNGKGYLYNWDKNNFQPRISVAYSPSGASGGLWHAMFGDRGKSVIRGGFAIMNDYYGEALASQFDLNNRLGYTSNVAISANTYNLTTNPGPLFTGFDQDVRTLPPPPGVAYPTSVSFPRQAPTDFSRRIESGIDTALQAPMHYQISLTFQRQFGAGMLFEASYVGRLARNLLASRDVMALNDLRDPKSGMDWYTAATMLEKQRQLGSDTATVQSIPYFDNILPAGYAATVAANGYSLPANATNTQAVYAEAAQFWANDWTDIQDEIENYAGQTLGQSDPVPYFFNPQYGALSAWGTIAKSNYHGFSASLRQRIHNLQWDFNYTYSHSLDNASGLQADPNNTNLYGSSFILNAIRPNDNYANSDFDLRHIINVNAIYQLPFGRGRRFGGNMNRGLDAFVGGWQVTGIYRWNTGLPNGQPYDTGQWATNWEVQSNTTQVVPVKTCPTRGDANNAPKLFGCDTVAAYQSYRPAYPGETGPRNVLRAPGYVALDMGLSKAFKMPWSEKQQLALRWEVFNVTNTQHLTGADSFNSDLAVDPDAALANIQPPGDWSNFTKIQGTPRVMQIGLRFSF
jgi:Carboxypeptidase regulatory-like domain